MTLNIIPTFFQDSLSLPSSEYNLQMFNKRGIPTSDQLTGITVRLSRIFIVDNKQEYIPLIIRYSDLYLIVTIIDDLGGEPQTISIRGFADVDDNEELPVDRTAYYWQAKNKNDKAPSQIHLALSVIKSNDGIRNTGAAMQELQKSQDYKDIVKNIVNVAASGGASLISDGLMALTGLLGSILGKVDDTPLITTVMSFTAIDGSFDNLGKHIITKKNRFAEVEVTLVVRDKDREEAIIK